jgi:hypothetical protein
VLVKKIAFAFAWESQCVMTCVSAIDLESVFAFAWMCDLGFGILLRTALLCESQFANLFLSVSLKPFATDSASKTGLWIVTGFASGIEMHWPIEKCSAYSSAFASLTVSASESESAWMF